MNYRRLNLAIMKLYWFNKCCCVPECHNSSTGGRGVIKEYFDLPAAQEARQRWLNVILIEDADNLKVCEEHFRDEDIFRDKTNRKKLRLNSTPSLKLPTNICKNCLGFKGPTSEHIYKSIKYCDCKPPLLPSSALLPIQPQTNSGGKRTRLTWTMEEKRTIFKAIKSHGEVKFNKERVVINWNNVVNYCRSNGCFGNEKELKSAWQYLRQNAVKVYKNEIYGNKLERKVSRFLFGNPPKRSRKNSSKSNSEPTTEDEDQQKPFVDVPKTEPKMENIDEQMVPGNFDVEMKEFDEEDDEYYSLSDVERIFRIQIRPPEVISLVSDDEV